MMDWDEHQSLRGADIMHARILEKKCHSLQGLIAWTDFFRQSRQGFSKSGQKALKTVSNDAGCCVWCVERGWVAPRCVRGGDVQPFGRDEKTQSWRVWTFREIVKFLIIIGLSIFLDQFLWCWKHKGNAPQKARHWHRQTGDMYSNKIRAKIRAASKKQARYDRIGYEHLIEKQ